MVLFPFSFLSHPFLKFLIEFLALSKHRYSRRETKDQILPSDWGKRHGSVTKVLMFDGKQDSFLASFPGGRLYYISVM